MKQKKTWRYYCEFCKKSGGRKDVIIKHEKACTLNPDRRCGMCNLIGNDSAPLSEMIIVAKKLEDWLLDYDNDHKHELEIIEELRTLSDNCPACILSAIRQAGQFAHTFRFKEEMDDQMSQYNKDNADQGHY